MIDYKLIKKKLPKKTLTIIKEAIKNKELIYIAVPYTHKLESIRNSRFDSVTEVSGMLAAAGVANLSPITQSHMQAMYAKIGTKWRTWKRIDTIFLQRCDQIWVVNLPGTVDSVGVTAELEIARSLDIPVRAITFNELTKVFSISDEV